MSNFRHYLRVPSFDDLQNPRRPNRPTWIKSFVRDLDDPEWLGMSLTNRGFLTDFQKLAASMMNRVPDDVRFIARKLNTPPAVAGKALNTCLTHGFIVRFDEDMNTSRNNDLYQKTDSRPIPPSLSPSNSMSTSGSNYKDTTGLTIAADTSEPCLSCDGEGCRWCVPLPRLERTTDGLSQPHQGRGLSNILRPP